jgi:hypothetical protein
MLRFITFTFIIILVETGIVYFISEKLTIRFLDLLFYAGVFFMLTALFFSSSGGLISNMSESKVMDSAHGMFGGFKHKRKLGSVSLNPFVVGSVLFLILSIVLSTFFY